MANSIKFMNEGFDAKYGSIKPDLKEDKLRMQLDALGNEKERRKSNYQSNVKRSQSEINRLLKRESVAGDNMKFKLVENRLNEKNNSRL